MKLKATITSNSTGIVSIPTRGQNAGIVLSSQAEYSYIDAKDELKKLTLNTKNNEIGNIRVALSQLFTSKRIHDQRNGRLEMQYNSSGDSLFNNKMIFSPIDSSSSNIKIATMRIPLSEVLEGCNYQHLINLKQLVANITFKEADKHWKSNECTNADSTTTNIFKSIVITEMTLYNPSVFKVIQLVLMHL